jgi:hypothetical protein
LQQPRKIKQKTKSKSFEEGKRQKAQSRVPVTASNALATFHDSVKREAANQMAAPADTRTPNMHRAKRIAPRECGWKHGDSGDRARRKNWSNKMKKEFT